jgi:hypothetical protein
MTKLPKLRKPVPALAFSFSSTYVYGAQGRSVTRIFHAPANLVLETANTTRSFLSGCEEIEMSGGVTLEHLSHYGNQRTRVTWASIAVFGFPAVTGDSATREAVSRKCAILIRHMFLSHVDYGLCEVGCV